MWAEGGWGLGRGVSPCKGRAKRVENKAVFGGHIGTFVLQLILTKT